MTPDPSFVRQLRDCLDLATVERAFGDKWHIIRESGQWCAMRRGGGVVVWDGPRSLIRHVVCAERLDDLTDQLCLQDILGQLSPPDLERVYAAGDIPDDLFAHPGEPEPTHPGGARIHDDKDPNRGQFR